MTQTLMASFEEDNEPGTVFPDTHFCLFLGGPKHGLSLEVIRGDPVHKVMAPATPTPMDYNNPVGIPAYEVHPYVRREMGFEDGDGTRYVRTVYVHESVPNPQVAQQILMAYLISEFARGGQKVIEHDGQGSNTPRG